MRKEMVFRGSRIVAFATVMFTSATLFASQVEQLAPSAGGDGGAMVGPVNDNSGNIVLTAPNTENDWTGTATGNITTTSNWNLGHVPTVAEDAVFTSAIAGGIKTYGTGATVGAPVTVGSLDVTATSGTYSIRNSTTSATDAFLTLGGPGDNGNGVTGSAPGDLIFVANGATLALRGDNASGTGVLRVVLGQSGNFDAVGTINVSSIISDGGNNFGITKTGAGSLILSGANTFGGGVALSAGTLSINNNSALGSGTFAINGGQFNNTSGAAVTVSNAETWAGDFAIGIGSGTNNLTLSGPVTLTGTRSVSVSGATSTVTVSGAIGDGGNGFGLTKSGPGVGVLFLTGANTYTGATTINSGTLQLGNGGTTGSLSPSSAISIATNATLRFDRTTGADFVQGTDFSSSAITGGGSIVKDGTASLTFNVANSFTGGLVINKGTVVSAVDGALGTGNISLTAGNITLTLNGASNNIANTATLSYVNTDVINLGNGTTDTVAGLIVDGVSQGPGVYGASATNPDGAFFGVGTITVTAVPEPTTIGMLLLGGGLLSAVQRFRRKQS